MAPPGEGGDPDFIAGGLAGTALAWSDYPYQVLCGSDGEEPDTVIAMAATPMTAFAAYYAAVRERLGATVVLKHNGRVIQRSGPR